MQHQLTNPAAVALTQPRPNLRRRGVVRFLREAAETLGLVVTLYALVNLASARFIVEGDSMQPNFATGQFLLISRANYLIGQPERGDIVVFHYPLNPEMDFIKRVIGLPGDTVEMIDTRVHVNGAELDEPYIREACLPQNCRDQRWEVSAGQYFVMGDNRNESRDSRAFGPVDRRYMVGEALVRYWPLQDLGIVSQYRYSGETEITD